MHFLGVDIGSSATKMVALDEADNVVAKSVVPLGTGTAGVEKALQQLYTETDLRPKDCSYTVATGYGRLTFEAADFQMSEITCHAKGIKRLVPAVHTIIDIGGQDSKAIQLDDRGVIAQFVMNDKCAAGTGRFLEVMSKVLDLDISQLGTVDAQATEILPISNTCTVFAESEVISQLSSGKPIPNILAGIHQAVAKRVVGLVLRIGLKDTVVLTGGVAKNGGIVRALEEELKIKLTIPPEPQLTGALGAATIARERYLKENS